MTVEITAEEAKRAISEAGLGCDGKVTDAPNQVCPQCDSKRVIWVQLGFMGYLLCVDCKKAGWSQK